MNQKGFTLIELLAVIVLLSIIMVIVTTNVIKSVKDSKEKMKYIKIGRKMDILNL